MAKLKKSLNWRVAIAVCTVVLLTSGFNIATKPIADDCLPNAVFDTEQVSWVAWLTGRSSSYRFHFLDLLELMSRHTARDSE
ncbi:hypothetical protein [Alteromonas gilva]|uniref:Uncharacterized protein n=1 Tax=Alteromonas gilva TaxID=2987522 RepID=A0ABT5L4Y4_9ALTE|nr:hypothetical protein [Alteromonas gilva]MDC8832113.1 hypothetical protein [Alteromonas gilva]